MNRGARFAKTARLIAPEANIVGALSSEFGNPLSKHFTLNRLDSYIQIDDSNKLPIKSRYAQCFSCCLGVNTEGLSAKKLDSIDIPQQFINSASKKVSNLKSSPNGKTLFINHLSTNEKRDFSWQQTRDMLLKLGRLQPSLSFFLNVPPNQVDSFEQRVSNDNELSKLAVKVFSAYEHFFQLPALIKVCDFVVSVETAVMHLAAALQKPQLILMRENAKQWQPPETHHVLFGAKRVDQIDVDDVVSSIIKLMS